MKTPADGWDEDEQQIPEGLARELAAAGRRGEQPPLDVLRAAGEGVLPGELEASAQAHLARNQRTRGLIGALNDSAALDAEAETRLFNRITQETRAADRERRSPPWRWQVAAALGTVALVGSAWWMTRRADPAIVMAPPPAVAAHAPQRATPAAPAPPAFLIPLERPRVRISLRAMTWRGQGADNPVLVALKPALEAFRAGDDATADREFAIVAERYPDLVEAALYQGVARLFLNDWSGAAVHLKRAQAIGDPAFAGDVAWYLAIAEERSGDVAAAQLRLRSICDRDGSAKACELLPERQ